MNRYPVYIVSKGRYKNPLTANLFKSEGIKFLIAVEPQEYDDYCNSVGKEYVLKLPFTNLGVGSFPARNYCWEHSIKRGYKRHWVFDDNIRNFERLHKGKRIRCRGLKALQVVEDFTDRYINIGISGFNYHKFGFDIKSPFYLNVHVYSALLINNEVSYRWRLKYNEDVDLCLQMLENKLCTVLFNSFLVAKVSTAAKMKGGNQTELYCDNAFDKKLMKVESLRLLWPNYVKTVFKYNRPHHQVSWKKFFKHPLVRRKDIDFSKLKTNNYGLKLRKIA
jgi:hypothetical protein